MEVAADVAGVSRPTHMANSTISGSSSSMLTHSIASPSSSLTSILTNSPTSSASCTSSNQTAGTSSSADCAPLGSMELAGNQTTLSLAMGPPSEQTSALAKLGQQQGDETRHSHGSLERLEPPVGIAQHHELDNCEAPAVKMERLELSASLGSPQGLGAILSDNSQQSPHDGDHHHEMHHTQILADGPLAVGAPLDPGGLANVVPQAAAAATTTTTLDLLVDDPPAPLASSGSPTTLGPAELRGRLPGLAHGIEPMVRYVEPLQASANTAERHPSSSSSSSAASSTSSQPLMPENRLERSNSCSQAECSAVSSVTTFIGQLSIGPQQTISLSHDNLSAAKVADDDLIGQHNVATANVLDGPVDCSYANHFSQSLTNPTATQADARYAGNTHPNTTPVASYSQPSGNPNALTATNTSFKNNQPATKSATTTSSSYSSSFSSTSARFFSSKLNTGSLWSLLSVGSNSSSVMNETCQTNDSFPGDADHNSSDNKQSANGSATGSNYQNNLKHHQDNIITSMGKTSTGAQTSGAGGGGGFLSRYQFIRSQSSQQPNNSSASNSDQQQQASSVNQKRENQSQVDRKRYRFNVKYIGSALLHKNFTLPMLEWIAKDIRRQTIRGAQSTTQRQFTIPSRDIVFEIQSNQLTAISCKDNHCIFVHPMHCVSKYVQLQHDSTCFAYIIRDTKDSPSFCHVFQAKNVGKVHDIFSAIREATTRTQLNQHQQTTIPGPDHLLGQTGASAQVRLLQKSASTDGHWRSLLNPTDQKLSINNTAVPGKLPGSGAGVSSNSACPKTNVTVAGCDPNSSGVGSAAPIALHAQGQSQAQIQFENSYQFEVMFVKRVKLQCRRVPPSFVDDALETLKSYEVSLKGGLSDSKSAQIKGVGKRIINASVDERQEYDESCQSPTPAPVIRQEMARRNEHHQALADKQQVYDNQLDQEQRRGSSASLRFRADPVPVDEFRESKSCQQSPTKLSADQSLVQDMDRAQQLSQASMIDQQQPTNAIDGEADKLASNVADVQMKKHQSVDCLKSIDYTIGTRAQADEQTPPAYTNDFSPYSTITSSDLNERIAAIPVVSGNSVSLDHETRQKLARQVRETIMATAANIKRGVYASGDKLDSSSSSKALDSLSCNVISAVPPVDPLDDGQLCSDMVKPNEQKSSSLEDELTTNKTTQCTETGQQQAQFNADEHRRSSACTISSILQRHHQQSSQASNGSNNFDLFRRASARQVVKNRTMLLLIGKDELCAISIDKHQMLFSKSFNSIVHCLQGNSNKDHFGLICRDSGKINPQAESYAGYVFKCQSDKVVREIMGALKQVIYSSQHNYHGYNSPYNPLNSVVGLASSQFNQTQAKQQLQTQHQHQQQQQQQHRSPRLDGLNTSPANSSADSSIRQQNLGSKQKPTVSNETQANSESSLAAKRGFANPLGLDEASKLISSGLETGLHAGPPTAPVIGHLQQHQAPAKNLIKSMFCDNCPLYWYHRLCCDVESLPAEASKTIILRRIDSSLSDKEQDDVYSRFSEFNIDSIEEHNEIFMSILRHQCERKQLKHAQSHAHSSALAKQASMARQQSNLTISTSQNLVEAPSATSNRASSASRLDSSSFHQRQSSGSFQPGSTCPSSAQSHQHHQRSGSTSGSLANILSQQAGAHSLADAGSAYIDNLKRAKNTISVSIENLLKRRPSIKDEQESVYSSSPPADQQSRVAGEPRGFPTRSGSFKSASRESRTIGHHQNEPTPSFPSNTDDQQADSASLGCLKRSQSSSDYSHQARGAQWSSSTSWRDSLSRTLNESADLSANNPLVGFFRRRGSMVRSGEQQADDHSHQSDNHHNQRPSTKASTESLAMGSELQQPAQQLVAAGGGPGSPTLRSLSSSQVAQGGGTSPSSMLSGVFWKKSIFDKIRQPVVGAMGWTGDQACGGLVDEYAKQQLMPQSTKDRPLEELRPKRTRKELRDLWKKAILEQITLLKMDKQNQKLQSTATKSARTPSTTTQANAPSGNEANKSNLATITSSELSKIEIDCCGNNIQGIKLNYRDVPYGREAPQLWDQLLKQDPTKKVEFMEVARLVRLGVPKQLRGEAWMFLMNQYQLRHGTSFQPADREFNGDANQTYRSLLSQLSTQQHEIFVDIGRTFPTHPYYSQYLSIGQLSLFNLLKAYSLLDQEVGYCQGLSFVAGILLLHVDTEDEAFELMRHLLFNFGLRKQYLPSMNALHLQLYQMTRLLRDHEYDIFSHFDNHDISPSLYAAPWFLTLFASQFPLGFVARLLDLIFLIGIEAIFRVSLTLLAYQRTSILKCSCLEATMEFMRRDLVKIDDKNLSKIFDKSLSLDLRNKLIEYEIEYSFYCAEEKARASQTLPLSKSISTSSNDAKDDIYSDEGKKKEIELSESTSRVADATATVIIQHLLANNHLKSLRSNYSY